MFIPKYAAAALLAALLLLVVVAAVLLRRYRAQRQARIRAERECANAERLHQLLAALSQARTSAAVLEAWLLECTYSLGAASGLMLLVRSDSETADVKRTVGFTDDTLPAQVRLDAGTWLGEALRAKRPQVSESRAARVAQYGDRPDERWLARTEASAVVPVLRRGRVVALAGFMLHAPRRWDEDDLQYLQDASMRVGQAFERARAYELAERARAEAETLRARADVELAERQRAEAALRDSEARYRGLAARTSRLHALTAALSEAITVEGVASAVLRQGKLVAGAQAGAVHLLIDNGTHFLALMDETAPSDIRTRDRFPAEPGLCLTEAAQTRRPVFVGSFADWQKRYWKSASRAADGGFESTVALALLIEGAPIGVLSFYFTLPVNFDDEYAALLVSVAQHCAQALDRARLYEAEHGARAVAEAANRLKDDFLSTVSHELRTPLNAILGWASMLRSGTVDPARTTRALQAIQDNAARQARLVDELLDVSRISAGRGQIDVQLVELHPMIEGAIETILPTAEAGSVQVRTGPFPPVQLMADTRRLEQVFLNLLSNAVKFTPAGGLVEVNVEVSATTVEVRVSDTGIGIDPEFLPDVFERFRQEEANLARRHGGLGLGMWIARHLVEAHGGSIHVESAGRDRGTTFRVTLPVASAAEPAPRIKVFHSQAG